MLKIVCQVCGSESYSSVTPKEHVNPECPKCGADLRRVGEVEPMLPKSNQEMVQYLRDRFRIVLDPPSLS